MAMQNLADLEMLYGKKSETIFSQTYTEFVFRTSDGRSAESLSKLAGDVDLLRLRETHSHGPSVRGRNASFSAETVREPRILPSEIQALPNLQGYFLQPVKILPFKMRRFPVERRAPAQIERIIPSMHMRPLEPETTSEAAGSRSKKQFKKKEVDAELTTEVE